MCVPTFQGGVFSPGPLDIARDPDGVIARRQARHRRLTEAGLGFTVLPDLDGPTLEGTASSINGQRGIVDADYGAVDRATRQPVKLEQPAVDPTEARRRRLAAQGRGMTVLGDLDAPDRAPPGPPLFLQVPREDATPEQRRRFFARNRGMRVPGPGEEMSSVRLMTSPHGDRLPPFRVDDQGRSQQGRSPVPLSSHFRSLEGTIPTSPLLTVQHGQPKNKNSAPEKLAEDPVERFPERTQGPDQRGKRPSKEKLDSTEKAARLTVEEFRDRGWSVAADMMEAWLKGRLNPKSIYRVTADWARDFSPVQSAEEEVKQKFENWLNAKEGFKDSNHGFPTIEIKDGESREIGDLRQIDAVWLRDKDPEDTRRRRLDPHLTERAAWEQSFETPFWLWPTDGRNALGNANVVGVARLKLRRRGDWVTVRGKILFQLQDRYDWDKDDRTPFPHTIFTDIPFFSQRDLFDLEQFRRPNSFDVRSEPWFRELNGRLRIENGKVVFSTFKWLDP